MTKHIQDMTFSIVIGEKTTGIDYRSVKLVNDDGEVIISHTFGTSALNILNTLEESDRNKSLAAHLVLAYQYTRDYTEGTGAARVPYTRSALSCLEQYVVENNLGEFTEDDFKDVVLPVYHHETTAAVISSPNGYDLTIKLRRQEGALWTEQVRYFTDEDIIPTIEALYDEWREKDQSRLQIEPAAVLSFGEVNFVYAVDISEAARVRREAVLQITIGERLVAEQRVFEGSKPLLYFILEVFNMLALRFRVGIAAGIGDDDRVILLNAIAGLVGGHMRMGEHVQVEAGLVYAYEGQIDDQVTFAVSHELTAENRLKVNYRFMRMSDDTIRRSVEMVDEVEYLESPMTPLEFYNAFQVDIARELGVARRFEIAMIAAIDRASGLGKGNELLYRIKEDMQYFKETTLHSPVIMGRKTYDSLPNPLIDRMNIVITTQSTDVHTTKSGVVFVNSKEEALAKAVGYLTEHGGDKIWIIGGAQIYAMFLPDAVELHLTVINGEREDADTFFPEINPAAYEPQRLFEQDEVIVREGEEISYNRYIMRRK